MDTLHTAIASPGHRSQRNDVKPENLSVGYWQAASVYCLIGQPYNARTRELLPLKHAQELSPFYKGYAYGALARAETITKNRVIMKVRLEKAKELLEQVEDEQEKQLLTMDLRSIR